MLKLQPKNAEALAELLSLVPSEKKLVNGSAAAGSSSSPSSSIRIHESLGEGRSYNSGGSSSKSVGASSCPSSSSGKENHHPPFVLAEPDSRSLRISTIPLQVEMPVFTKWAKGKGKVNNYEVQIETYSYPTWDRCKVVR